MEDEDAKDYGFCVKIGKLLGIRQTYGAFASGLSKLHQFEPQESGA